MTRRWVGILMLLLAATVVIAVPGLKGGRIVGNATAAPVSPPPQVGECLLDPPNLAEAQSIYAQKPWTTGACAGKWYGEVTAVIDDPDEPASWTQSAGAPVGSGSLPELVIRSCQAAANDYVGAVASDTTVIQWSPALRVGSAAIDPSSRQQTVGQHWRACVLYLLPDDPTVPAVAPPVNQTLRDAIATGAMSGLLGACTTDAGFATFEYISCTQPHSIQFIALGSVDKPIQRDDPVPSCTALAQKLTGRSDLQADEALDIRSQYVDLVQTEPTPVAIEGAEIPAGSYAICSIRSSDGRLLEGSLLGLGDRPIPWS